MKKINIKKALVIAIAITTVTFSCKDSFLEVPPTASLTEDILGSRAGVEGALIAAYSMLNGKGYSRLAAPNNWVLGSITGGEANKGTDAGDYVTINPIQRYETDPVNPDVESTWLAKFEGISRANATLRIANASTELSPTQKTRILGEARFLRGHYYFDLKRIFYSVPFIDETLDYGKGIEAVKNTPDIWGKIEEDFKFAMDNLPETHGDAGRANKWAAAAYLAKVYLYQNKFAQAKDLFNDVIQNGRTTNGKKYGLVPHYAQIFNAANDNHEESVFAVQSSMNTGNVNNSNWFDDLNYPYNTGPDGPGNCCGFFQPSFSLANAFRTNGGLPLLDGSYNNPANALKHDYGIQSSAPFTPDAGPLDPRIDHSIGRRGIPYLDWRDHPGRDWIRDQAYAGPYSNKKYVYYKTQENVLTDGSSWTRGYATMNYTIIRFADVLLMAAEAEIEAGSVAKGIEYINLVRARAANQDGWVKKNGEPAANYVISQYPTSLSQADARNAVRFERLLELSGEGHRFFDLVRWGIADVELNKYLQYEAQVLVTKFGGASFKKGKTEYMPIPQGQLDLQKGVLTQNPGY
jgi:starch-binding outer membrane protein, SusD/RagB family